MKEYAEDKQGGDCKHPTFSFKPACKINFFRRNRAKQPYPARRACQAKYAFELVPEINPALGALVVHCCLTFEFSGPASAAGAGPLQ